MNVLLVFLCLLITIAYVMKKIWLKTRSLFKAILPLAIFVFIFMIDLVPLNLVFNYLCENKVGIKIHHKININGIYEPYFIDCNISKIKDRDDLYLDFGLDFQEYNTQKLYIENGEKKIKPVICHIYKDKNGKIYSKFLNSNEANFSFKYYGYGDCSDASNEKCNVWIRTKKLVLENKNKNKIAEYKDFAKINLFKYAYLSAFGELSHGYVDCNKINNKNSNLFDNKLKILKELNYE